MNDKKASSVIKVFQFAGQCKPTMIGSVIFEVLGVLCGMLPYYSVAVIAGALFAGTADSSFVVKYTAIAVIGETIKMILVSLAAKLSHSAAYGILENIRCQLTDKMTRIPMGIMTETPSGKLKSMVVDTVEKLENPLAHMIPEITANLVTPLAIIIILFILDWRMALASLISLPIGAVALMGMMRDYEAKSTRYMKASSAMDSALVEYVNGIQVIKAFNHSNNSFRKFSEAIKYYHDTTIEWWKDTWLFSALGYAIMPSALIGSLPIGALLLMRGSLDVQTFLICLALSIGIAGPLIQLTDFVENLAVVDASVKQVCDFLDQPELDRPEKPVQLSKAGYEFKKVSFAYGDKEVLHGISFAPEPGKMTAIVGPSGSGKTTVTKLMANFWDPSSGSVCYGGQDLHNIPLKQMAEEISFVSQDNFLFNISIKDNILLGKPNATDEEVYAAAKAARCHEFILNLENGYDTLAGESGGHLSGGERQRITLARAILKNANVVILDEATAYADPENEAYIQKAINNLVKGKTQIVVAHRLSTIKDADQIIVIDKGRIADSGTHDQLLDRCPLYRTMWENHIAATQR